MKTITILIAAFGLLLSSGITAETFATDEERSISLVSYEMTISGTSTLHDWVADVTEVEANITMLSENPDFTTAFKNLEVKVPVEKIDSGKSGMDSRIYSALKSRRHSEIIYTLSEITSAESTGENTFTLATVGDLTIAGTTKSITMDVKAVKNGDNSYTFTGSYTTKMTAFDVEPPTAMLGTVRAGDEITVDFSITVK